MITIRKQEWVTVELDYSLPYYYHQNLSSEHGRSDIYGRIEANKCTTIHIDDAYDGDKTVEVGISEYTSFERSGLGCYFSKEFESTESEFLEMLLYAKKFIESV